MSTSTRPEPVLRTCSCPFAVVAPAHHDRLLRAATEVSIAVELMELAVTWGEIDYGAEALVPPGDWLTFAAWHDWPDEGTAERLFSVAVDVVRAHTPVPFNVFI